MPSKAYGNFRYNLVDVDRLIESHKQLKTGNKGKQGLGHITRSGVVMLCASWELFLEELIRESVNMLSERLDTPMNLPKPAQKALSNSVKSAKHELRPLHLAGDGWRQVYRDHTNLLTERFNTPKANQINELFKKTVGIEDLTSFLTINDEDINDFVTMRGDIAHRGRHASYIKIGQLQWYKDMIVQIAIEVDNTISAFIRTSTNGKWPWYFTS